MRLLPGVASPLSGRGPADIDTICVRENSVGEYTGASGRLYARTRHEVAGPTGIFTGRGIERIVRYAFELESRRPRKELACATKSNTLQYLMVLWDAVVEEVSADYPAVSCGTYHVDALAARMVTKPVDAIWAGALMLDHLGEHGGHDLLVWAVAGALAKRDVRTPDVGERATTADMTEAIRGAL